MKHALALLLAFSLCVGRCNDPTLAQSPTPAPDQISTTPAEALRGAAGTINAVATAIDKEPPAPSDADWTERPPAEVVAGKLARFELKAKPTGPVQWFAFARGVNALDPAFRSDTPHIAYVETDEPGAFIVVATWDGGKAVAEFVVKGGVVPVPPVPPGPTPPPGPVVEGAKRIVLIRESLDGSPEMGRLEVGLQSGAAADYFRSKGHTVEIYDDEAKDENGEPSKYVAQWLKVVDGLKLPALVIVDAKSGAVSHRQALEMRETTAAGVVEIAKRVGG